MAAGLGQEFCAGVGAEEADDGLLADIGAIAGGQGDLGPQATVRDGRAGVADVDGGGLGCGGKEGVDMRGGQGKAGAGADAQRVGAPGGDPQDLAHEAAFEVPVDCGECRHGGSSGWACS